MDKEHLITSYFENSQTEEERLLMEELLKSDAEFLEEFTFRKNLKLAFQRNQRIELKEKLRIHESQKQVKPTIQLNWKYVAAAILILGFGTYFMMNSLQNSEDLYSQYYETYPNLVAPVVRGDNQDANLETKAFQAYENKEFKQAVALFSDLYKTNQKEYALFYQAMSYLEIEGQTQEAVSLLKNTDWSKEFKEKSLWYLALAQLKIQNTEEAKKSLQSLQDLGNYRQDQVKQLLDQL